MTGPATEQDLHAIFFHPDFSDPTPRTRHVLATNGTSTCDNSAVVGGKAPITNVAFKFTANFLDGTCAALTSSPQFANAHLRVRWQGINPAGKPYTLAVSRAKLATASYDAGSNALLLIMQPIATGAFVGETLTLHLGFDIDAATFNQDCKAYAAMTFGVTNPSTIGAQ